MILTIAEHSHLLDAQKRPLIFKDTRTILIPKNRTFLNEFIGPPIITDGIALIPIKCRAKFYTGDYMNPLDYDGLFAADSLYRLKPGHTLGLSSDAAGYQIRISLK